MDRNFHRIVQMQNWKRRPPSQHTTVVPTGRQVRPSGLV
jgi:hypothetical protein